MSHASDQNCTPFRTRIAGPRVYRWLLLPAFLGCAGAVYGQGSSITCLTGTVAGAVIANDELKLDIVDASNMNVFFSSGNVSVANGQDANTVAANMCMALKNNAPAGWTVTCVSNKIRVANATTAFACKVSDEAGAGGFVPPNRVLLGITFSKVATPGTSIELNMSDEQASLNFDPGSGMFSGMAVVGSVTLDGTLVINDPAIDPVVGSFFFAHANYTGSDTVGFSDLSFSNASINFFTLSGEFLSIYSEQLVGGAFGQGSMGAFPVDFRNFVQTGAQIAQSLTSSAVLNELGSGINTQAGNPVYEWTLHHHTSLDDPWYCHKHMWRYHCWANASVPPEVTIVSANPPLDNPWLDGQQPYRDVAQTGNGPGLTQGIGVTPPIQITFDQPVTLGLQDIQLACSGGNCPSVATLTPLGSNAYQMVLSGAIPPGYCTTLVFGGAAGDASVAYESLPGDASLDGTSNTIDLLGMVQAINNGSANQPINVPRYDIDRSGGVNTSDLLREVQLLNGVNTTQPWNGRSIVPCSP